MMQYKHMITNVCVFTNDMVMVFDQDGKQMPDFQGKRTVKLMKKIKDRQFRQKTPVAWNMNANYRVLKVQL